MKQVQKRLTYANVMSTLAVFLVLGGAGAVAAKQLGQGSVGPKQLRKGSVTAAKIRKGAVNSAKVKDRSLLAQDFKEDQLPRGATGPVGPPGPIEGTPAGGALAGTYPNPEIAAGAIGTGQVGTVPAVRARTSVPQTIANSTGTVLSLSSANPDPTGMFNNATDSLVVKVPGIYMLGGTIGWLGDAAGSRQIRLVINGTAWLQEVNANPGANSMRQSFTTLNRLQAGDQVQLGTFQSSGGDLDTGVSEPVGSAALWAAWLGP